MDEPIRVVELTKTCDFCPAQWSGKTDAGREVYVRFRWGTLTIELDDELVFRKEIGEPSTAEEDNTIFDSMVKAGFCLEQAYAVRESSARIRQMCEADGSTLSYEGTMDLDRLKAETGPKFEWPVSD